jgi:uracil-DNA glycosylase
VKVSTHVNCKTFPCSDVRHECFIAPDIQINPKEVSVILISEAAPESRNNYYYAPGDPHFQQTTVMAFHDAGIQQVSTIKDILELGVYMTTAVKCAKTGYGIKASTIKQCSFLLEKEINLFPDTQVFLLMGDVAIKAVNYISKKSGEGRVIPAISTYKLRGQEFFFKSKRAFPSYLQVGPSFNIEKSKRRMIAEDIAAALHLMK